MSYARYIRLRLTIGTRINYDRNVKKRNICLLVSLFALISVMTATFTGCLKIGMRKDNIIKRLNDKGYSVSYLSTTDMIKEQQSKYKIGDIVYACFTNESTAEIYAVYVYFCLDDKSADFAEQANRGYNDEAGTYSGWNIYRYDNVVMFGDYRAIAVARNY